MSSQIEKLQEKQTQLIMQRSQGKDIVEQSEKELTAIVFAIQNLNEFVKNQEEEAKAAEAEANKGDPKIPAKK